METRRMLAQSRGLFGRWSHVLLAFGTLLVPAFQSPLFAQDDSPTPEAGVGILEKVWWAIAFVGSIIALGFAVKFYKSMMEADEGNPKMIEIAGHVRDGAKAYLTQQYKVVFVFFVVICLLLGVAAYLGVQSDFVPFAFLTGGFFSGLAGYFGMKTATWASSRTAAGAQQSLNAGL